MKLVLFLVFIFRFGATGAAIVRSPKVAKILFIGSPEVGAKVIFIILTHFHRTIFTENPIIIQIPGSVFNFIYLHIWMRMFSNIVFLFFVSFFLSFSLKYFCPVSNFIEFLVFPWFTFLKYDTFQIFYFLGYGGCLRDPEARHPRAWRERSLCRPRSLRRWNRRRPRH